MHGGGYPSGIKRAAPDDSAFPLTYMIVYIVSGDDGKKKTGVYMFDEETVKIFGNYQDAAQESNRLDNFMRGCGYNCYTRIVKVVDN